MKKLEDGEWSIKYSACKACGKTNIKHRALGLCQSCYVDAPGMRERAENRKKNLKGVNMPQNPIIPCSVERETKSPEVWSQERIDQEAKDLVEWSLSDDCLVLEEFGLYRDPPYSRSQMYALASKNKKMSSALIIAKERIRSRREKGGVRGTFNPSMVQFTHGFYDRDNNLKDMSFTAYKDERKKVDDSSEITKQILALEQSKQFMKEAKEEIAKKTEVKNVSFTEYLEESKKNSDNE